MALVVFGCRGLFMSSRNGDNLGGVIVTVKMFEVPATPCRDDPAQE